MTAPVDVLARAVAALDGPWHTARAVTVLRDAGVPVSAKDGAEGRQARKALRLLRDRGVLVRVDSPPGTAVYRRTERSGG